MATNNQPGKDAFGMPIAYSNTDPNPIVSPTPAVPTVPAPANIDNTAMSKANIKLPTGQVISASDPNYAEYVKTYPNAIRVPSVIKASSDIVQDTSSIRDGVGDMTNRDANVSFDERYAQQTALEAELARIQGLAQGVNKTLDSELLAIENAGKAAGQEFDPLIAKAQEDKRMGEGKAIVGAGRRGGFMRLRDAGEAALGPTEGGTFFGQGGRLEALKSAYDRNIDQLNISKSQAIAAAKAAKETAIRTGKVEDVKLALSLYQAAADANNKAIELNNAKLDRILKEKQVNNEISKTPYEKAAKVAETISKLPVGQSIVIDGQTFTGTKPSEIDGFFKGSDIVALMKTLPSGQTKEITDPATGTVYTIQGLQSEDPSIKSIQTTDNSGRVTITSYKINPDGTIGQVNQADAGKIGKSGGSGNNISLNIAQNKMPIESKVYNALGGEWGTRAYNELSKKWEFFDLQGKPGTPPPAYTTTKPSGDSDPYGLGG